MGKFGFGSLGLSVADFLKPDAVIQLGYPPSRIDILTSIDGVAFEPCHQNRIEMKIDDISLPFLGLEDFRTNKRASGRARDLADLESLGEPPNNE